VILVNRKRGRVKEFVGIYQTYDLVHARVLHKRHPASGQC
jgi:hypothetical protein